MTLRCGGEGTRTEQTERESLRRVAELAGMERVPAKDRPTAGREASTELRGFLGSIPGSFFASFLVWTPTLRCFPTKINDLSAQLSMLTYSSRAFL